MTTNPVSVWLVPLDDSAEGVAESLGLELPEGDPARWAGDDARTDATTSSGPRDATDRLRRATSRLALRLLVSAGLDRHPDDVDFDREACRRCGGPHGRPVLARPAPAEPTRTRPVLAEQTDLRFSLSRSAEHALVALRRGADVGVDLERPTSGALAPPPDALRDWVRKEAVLKSTGHGLLVDPASFGVDRVDGARWQAAPSAAAVIDGHDLHLPDGLIGAVAGPGLGAVRVHLPSTRRS